MRGPKTTSYAASTTFTAQVSTSTGTPAIDAPILVSTRVGASAWQQVATLSSNTAGGASVTLHPTRTMTVRFVSGPTSVASQTVLVSSSVTSHPNVSAVRVGRSVRISGRVAPYLSGFVVKREVYSHGHWRVVATTRSGRNGVYSFKVPAASKGVIWSRVVVMGRGPLGGSESRAVRVAVI